jgi:hypothetical protein
MPKCPHCGEPVYRGQDRCYACGQKTSAARMSGRQKPVRPQVFVIGGAALVVAVIAIILFAPGRRTEQKARAAKAQLERVQDSVRKANREQQVQVSGDKEVDRLNEELAGLEQRFERVQLDAVGQSPSPGQLKLVSEIKTELGRLRQTAAGMVFAKPEDKGAVADTVRAGARRVRGLISDLTRVPKKR